MLTDRVEDDEYDPAHATFVVRDTGERTDVDEQARPGLVELGPSTGTGTLARTGHGWLHAWPRGAYDRVVLKAHDGPAPEPPAQGWADLLELPYVSATGSVALGSLAGGEHEDVLSLGAPGRYRVSLASRPNPGEDGQDFWEVCRLRFWPDRQDVVEPPRWLARRAPAVPGAGDGWDVLLSQTWWVVHTLGSLVERTASAVTPAGAAAVAEAAGHDSSWLGPLPWTTAPGDGSPLDWIAEDERAELEAVAHAVGAPVPRTGVDLLDLLVAVGVLEA